MEINDQNSVHNVPPYRGDGHYGLGPVTKKSDLGSFGHFGHGRSSLVLEGKLRGPTPNPNSDCPSILRGPFP